MGRQARRRQRHRRAPEIAIHRHGAARHLQLQQHDQEARILRRANEGSGDPVSYLEFSGREGRFQGFGHSEYLGRIPRFLHAGARQIAGAGHAQHLRLRLSADRQRGRSRHHVAGFSDGLWRQEPRHAGRQIAHRRSAGKRCGGQGDRQTHHTLQEGLRAAGRRQLERRRRQQCLPRQAHRDGFRRVAVNRGSPL